MDLTMDLRDGPDDGPGKWTWEMVLMGIEIEFKLITMLLRRMRFMEESLASARNKCRPTLCPWLLIIK